MWWEGWAGAVEWPLVTNSHASEALSGWSFLCGTIVVQLWYIPKCFLLCGIFVIGFGALVPACEAGAGAMK